MNHRGPACLSLAFALSLEAACSSANERILPPDAGSIPTLLRTEFPGLHAEDVGFVASEPDRGWVAGDQVVFLLRLQKGDTTHRWILRLKAMFSQDEVQRLLASGMNISLWEERAWTVTWAPVGVEQEFTAKSLMLPVSVTVHDENGGQLSSSLVKLPAELLSRGVLPAVDSRRLLEPGNEDLTELAAPSEQQIRPIVDAMIAMMALLNVVQEDGALAERFWQVVEKPSLWSVLTSLGAHATISMAFEKSVPVPALPPHLPAAERAFVVPLQIDVNGSPALFVDVVAIDAVRPFALCGGMIAATARHPAREDTRLELQLSGASVGKK